MYTQKGNQTSENYFPKVYPTGKKKVNKGGRLVTLIHNLQLTTSEQQHVGEISKGFSYLHFLTKSQNNVFKISHILLRIMVFYTGLKWNTFILVYSRSPYCCPCI